MTNTSKPSGMQHLSSTHALGMTIARVSSTSPKMTCAATHRRGRSVRHQDPHLLALSQLKPVRIASIKRGLGHHRTDVIPLISMVNGLPTVDHTTAAAIGSIHHSARHGESAPWRSTMTVPYSWPTMARPKYQDLCQSAGEPYSHSTFGVKAQYAGPCLAAWDHSPRSDPRNYRSRTDAEGKSTSAKVVWLDMGVGHASPCKSYTWYEP